MSTRNIVPRNDGEGNLGTATKKWNGMYTNTLNGRNVDNDGKKLDETRKGLTALENGVSTLQGKVTSMDSTIINNTNAINSLKAAVGSPLIAKTVAEMTDKSKIYVYTGTEGGYIKGNWYYNDGSSWVSGGVYNSIAFETDPTLTVSKQAADAKSTGDSLRALYKSMSKVKGDHFVTTDVRVPNNRIFSVPIFATKGTIIHLLKPNYYYYVNDSDWTKEDTVIDENKIITIVVSKEEYNGTTPDLSFDSVDEIEDIVGCLTPANELSNEELTVLHKSLNKVKGERLYTTGAGLPNNRIVSTPIYAPKGTLIRLIKPKYYYSVDDGDWTKKDTVIGENKTITILICKTPIDSQDPSTAFDSVDEIEDIVLCLTPGNVPEENKAISEIHKSLNKVKGERLYTTGAGLPNNRIVSTPIYAPKGTLIRLLKPKYYYCVDDGDWTKKDTVIGENKTITIFICKTPTDSQDPSTTFDSVDEIEDIVLCLTPGNVPEENKENKEIVRQATYSSENNYGEHLATPVFSLLHFSDLHADKDALKRIVEKGSEYPLDDMICTGDIVEDNASESIKDWWEPKILTCMGNHDVAIRTDHDGIVSYDWSRLTMQERDTKYISPFISQWGSVTHESGTSYYFKDYPNKKVRLVVVDIMLYSKGNGTTYHETESANQTQWLEETLQSAINLGYHVVIATHYPLLGARIKDCSFSPYDSDGILFDANAFTTILQDTVDKYVQKGLHFVCYLSGHEHKDALVYVDKTTKQIQILITCARTRGMWEWGDQYRGPDDDAMNIVCVDTYHNRLKLVRIGGANIDECMRPRKAICIDYSTGKICGEIK